MKNAVLTITTDNGQTVTMEFVGARFLPGSLRGQMNCDVARAIADALPGMAEWANAYLNGTGHHVTAYVEYREPDRMAGK